MGCSSSINKLPSDDEVKLEIESFLEDKPNKPNGFMLDYSQEIQEIAQQYIKILDKTKIENKSELREKLGDITGKDNYN